jgi:hypothetical protein
MLPPHVPVPGRVGSLGNVPEPDRDEPTAVTPEEAGIVVPTLAARLLGPLPRPVRIGLVVVLVPLLVLAPLAFVIWSVAR